LQSLSSGWITARQIEAGRVAITNFLQREGKVYIRIFPHKPVSGKPLETRMGKGKGETVYWAAVVREGTVLYEIGGVEEEIARSALVRASHKMPMRCRMVDRHQGV
jgi:large subunit ribosomal protein L16